MGCCGPAGLHVLPGKPPSMRVMPRFFLLSSSEDAPAQQLLLNLFVARSQELEVEVTDLFLDCACFPGVSSDIGAQQLDIKLHRCLEHVSWHDASFSIVNSSCSGVGIGSWIISCLCAGGFRRVKGMQTTSRQIIHGFVSYSRP